MIGLVWLGMIILLGIGIILVVRQAQGKLSAPTSPRLPGDCNIFTLRIGDIVQYEGADWVVEGQLTYNSQGYTWLEYLLQDGDRLRWLSVEEDDRVEVFWLEPATGLDIPARPPAQLTVAGITYHLAESGVAQMQRVGATLNRQGEQCQYFDYQSTDGQALSVEDWGEEREVTVGRAIRPGDLHLLPGDGQRVYRG